LGSKFTADNFKRIQIKINIDDEADGFHISDLSLDHCKNLNPKSIEISSTNFDIDTLEYLLSNFYPSILSFKSIKVEIEAANQFEKLILLSKLAHTVEIVIKGSNF
jgi:hypothetical protein